MSTDAIQPWLSLLGPVLEAKPLLAVSFFLGPTRLADLPGLGLGFRMPEAVAAKANVDAATLGRFLAASPQVYRDVTAAIMGPDGLAEWRALELPTDPAEAHARAGAGWTQKCLGPLPLFAIYSRSTINRAGLTDDRLYELADNAHDALTAAEQEHSGKAEGGARPQTELTALAMMPVGTLEEREAMYLAWHAMSESAKLRLEAEARRWAVRLYPGRLLEPRAAIAGAQRALHMDEATESCERRSDLEELVDGLIAADGDEEACAAAWEGSLSATRMLVERCADEPLLIYPAKYGGFSCEAAVVVAKQATEEKRRGRTPILRRGEAELELAADYLTLTGKTVRDWSRASTDHQPAGPYADFLRKVGSLYGGLALIEEL